LAGKKGSDDEPNAMSRASMSPTVRDEPVECEHAMANQQEQHRDNQTETKKCK
jgi:hypothetical protein